MGSVCNQGLKRLSVLCSLGGSLKSFGPEEPTETLKLGVGNKRGRGRARDPNQSSHPSPHLPAMLHIGIALNPIWPRGVGAESARADFES